MPFIGDGVYAIAKGDTLSSIARMTGTSVSYLLRLNPKIDDPNVIIAGESLATTEEASEELYGDSDTTQVATPNGVVTVSRFGLQSNTDRTVYAAWTVTNEKNVKDYSVRWTYSTGDGIDFVGSDTTTEHKNSTYNAPSNAISVTFQVKPNATTTKDANGNETEAWSGAYTAAKTYRFEDNPPSVPSGLNVTIDGFKLTATLDNLDINAKEVEFEVVKDNKGIFETGKSKIVTAHASWSCTLAEGGEYKVRCRGIRDKVVGEWSEYSDNYKTIPAPPANPPIVKALSATSVQVDWDKVETADSYDVQYTTQLEYFDTSSEVQSTSVESVVTTAIITGMESGTEYYFRVRAVNEVGESSWTKTSSVIIGTPPAPPTTWSSTTTAQVGDPLTLYWAHNSEDGSSQTYAILELTINGDVKEPITIENTAEEDERDKTSSYEIQTSAYRQGTKIRWRVKTKGITDEYSDYSIQRTIDVYAPPSLTLTITNSSGSSISRLTSFPIYISANAYPSSQTPTSFHISITAGKTYTTVDNLGNEVTIKAGAEVYSRHIDKSSLSRFAITPGDASLVNEAGSYTVTCTVSMDSGLSASSSRTLSVSLPGAEYFMNAAIAYDSVYKVAYVNPFCENTEGRLLPGITVSLYRREFDGSFTELASGLNNASRTYVTDPHPALDYARYRVVAVDDKTGSISYADIPAYPIGEKAVVIQWDDKWSKFETTSGEVLEQPPWAGNMLLLPYNIDVSDSHAPDVSLVEYIGRKHPVSYYGTQLGETSTWNVSIPKSDRETLYALRRLAVWMGDVYVREPSGSGYWAHVKVSFSQTHLDLTIPVTLDITRVSGGA